MARHGIALNCIALHGRKWVGTEEAQWVGCFPPSHSLTHSHSHTHSHHQASGLLQKVSANFFSKQIATGLKVYDAAAATDGSVYVKLR